MQACSSDRDRFTPAGGTRESEPLLGLNVQSMQACSSDRDRSTPAIEGGLFIRQGQVHKPASSASLFLDRLSSIVLHLATKDEASKFPYVSFNSSAQHTIGSAIVAVTKAWLS